MFSKKATKIDEIFTVDLTVTTYCQIDDEDLIQIQLTKSNPKITMGVKVPASCQLGLNQPFLGSKSKLILVLFTHRLSLYHQFL